MGRFDIVVGLFLILGSIIPAILSIQEYASKNPKFFSDPSLDLAIVIILIIGFTVLYGYLTYRMIRSLAVVIARFWLKFNVKLDLKNSKPYLGGHLSFDGTFNGIVDSAYIVIRFITPFGDAIEKFLYYDNEKKSGKIIWKHKDFKIHWAWRIPNDIPIGNYKIKISLYDIDNMLPVFKTRHIIRSESDEVTISEPPTKNIDIKKIIKPQIKKLDSIDFNSKQKSGWICVKIYNDRDIDYGGCYGQIITQDKQFPLYDYEEFLKNGGNQDIDVYLTFTLKNNSTKLLYSKIETEQDIVKILLEVGKEVITKELPLKFDN